MTVHIDGRADAPGASLEPAPPELDDGPDPQHAQPGEEPRWRFAQSAKSGGAA